MSRKYKYAHHTHTIEKKAQSNSTFNVFKHFSHFPRKHIAHCSYPHQYAYMFYINFISAGRNARKQIYFIIVDISMALQNRSVLRFSFPVRDNSIVLFSILVFSSHSSRNVISSFLCHSFLSHLSSCVRRKGPKRLLDSTHRRVSIRLISVGSCRNLRSRLGPRTLAFRYNYTVI